MERWGSWVGDVGVEGLMTTKQFFLTKLMNWRNSKGDEKNDD